MFQITALAQQASGSFLEISGDIAHPRTFQEEEWKQLKHVTLTATSAHDKKTATYGGVLLRDLLKEAGVPSGESLRGKGLWGKGLRGDQCRDRQRRKPSSGKTHHSVLSLNDIGESAAQRCAM